MGRAINQDNRLDDHERRIAELEGVVAELSQALMQTTQVNHVDLHEETADDKMANHEESIRKENKKSKKTTRKATART